MIGRDSEDEIWSRFVFELVIRTQPSGPLCLWQCLSYELLILLKQAMPGYWMPLVMFPPIQNPSISSIAWKNKPHSSSTISFQANRSLRASTSLPAITKANFCASLPENFNCCHFHVFRSFRPLEYGNSVTFWSGFGDYSSPPLVEPFETQKLRPVGHCGQETIKVC